MLVIRARLDIRPDMRADFLDAVTDVIHEGRHLNGVESFEICESITEPNVFLSVEVYEDEDAWRRHRESAIFTTTLPALRACLAGPVEGRAYSVAGTMPLEL